jgi:acyl carrier protein
MSDVAARVKKIVVEHLGVEADKVTEIPDDAAEQIQTVGDAVKFLEKHASAA